MQDSLNSSREQKCSTFSSLSVLISHKISHLKDYIELKDRLSFIWANLTQIQMQI